MEPVAITISSPGTYALTADVAGKIRITADNVVLNLNGHTVRGTTGTDIGIYSEKSGITVYNGEVTGFETGILLNGVGTVRGNKVSQVDVHDCSFMGIGVGNDSSRVHGCDVWNIGGTSILLSWGVAVWGKNSAITDTDVWKITGHTEAVAFGFNTKDNTGSYLSNCTADGSGAAGWSFGFWNSGGSVRVDNSRFTNWDSGIGSSGVTTVRGSTISDVAFIKNGAVVDGGGNSFAALPGNDASLVVGTSAMDTLVGGDGANTILGVDGFDHLAGRGGADVFLFGRGRDIVNVMDFKTGQDHVGVSLSSFSSATLQVGEAATGGAATFLYSPTRHILYYDPDGAGQQALEAVAYIPNVVLKQTDVVGVSLPYAGDAVGRLATAWGLEASGDFNDDGNVDLIWQNSAGTLGEWIIRGGERAATLSLPAMPGWQAIATGNFNGDGADDLIWRDQNGVMGTWIMDRGKLAATFALPSLKAWNLFAAEDFNGDGTSDLLWQNARGDLGLWLIRDGQRAATVKFLSLQGWEPAAAGDFNGDGTADLLLQNAAGVVGEWLIKDTERVATMPLPSMKGWNAIATADFNNDGTDDVLWQEAGGTLVAWMMQGGKVGEAVYFGEMSGSELLATGDVNGDGNADLLWRNLTTSDVKAWLL